MPSVSKAQQRLFGMALACKRGELKKCSDKVKELADSMSMKELEKYASTSHEDLPAHVKESIEIFEKETKTSKEDPSYKISDVPPAKADVKTPPPVVVTPEPPPGYVHSDKRNPPGFFTPSLFKRPGDKTVKSEKRLMDFPEFLKRINYHTHDGTVQHGHGQNLSGGKNT